jgi:hypothetical protein
VVSRDATSKYDFGVAVAHRFGLDESLITPTPVAASGLKAPRSPNLTLRTDKLAAALYQSNEDIVNTKITEFSPPARSWEEKGEMQRSCGHNKVALKGMRGVLPSWQESLERFYELYRSGYPQMLKQLAVASTADF